MNKQDLKISYAVFAGMCVGLGIIHWTCATGYILGAIISYILYWRNVRLCDTILANKATNRWGHFAHFMNNYALMAIALLLGAIFPQYINIFGVTLGLFLLKTAVIINTVKNRKESKG